MVRSGQWLIPMIGGDTYADKPPLFFWMIAIAYALTGSLRIAFLLPSLLASLGSLALVYDLGRRLWNREVGLAAGLLLLGTVQFVWQGRQAQIDATVCFWIVLGLYGAAAASAARAGLALVLPRLCRSGPWHHHQGRGFSALACVASSMPCCAMRVGRRVLRCFIPGKAPGAGRSDRCSCWRRFVCGWAHAD